MEMNMFFVIVIVIDFSCARVAAAHNAGIPSFSELRL